MKTFVCCVLMGLVCTPAVAQCFGGRCAARRAARIESRAHRLNLKSAQLAMQAHGGGYSSHSTASYGANGYVSGYTSSSYSAPASYGCAGSSMGTTYSQSYQTYSAPVSYGCFGSVQTVAPAAPAAVSDTVPEAPAE